MMHIGVPILVSDPTVGGGYTFETDLLVALLRAMPASRHRFTVLGVRSTPVVPLPAGCDYVNLLEAGPLARWAVGGGWNLARWVRYGLLAGAGLRPRPPVATELARRLERLGLQLLLHLSPHVVTTQLPFTMFVWDLEHRIQPYYPELSAGGEWEAREAHFGGTIPRAAMVAVGTATGRDQLEQLFRVVRERVELLPHPTPTDALTHKPRGVGVVEQFGLTKPYLIYPAQFWAHKNHVGLLRGLHTLRERGIAPLLALAGSDRGNRRHVERVAAALGVADQVRFLGFVDRPTLLDLIAHADLLVYPSTFGPENLPPLEAFALGCPAVVSDIPGAREQYGEAAIYFPPYDPHAIADQVAAVLGSPARRDELVRAGAARAAAWTADHLVTKLLEWVDRFARTRALWP